MRKILFLTSLLLWQCSYGQWFNNITTFTTQDGLSNNTIISLQKDSAGFLWIGTHEGLNRYDGTEFINVLSNEKNNLPSNNITKICVINKSTMVVGTDAGLCLLNTATMTGKKIDLPVIKKYALTGYYIADILYKKNTDELWVCTWHGLFVLNTKGELLHKLMSPESTINNGLFARHVLKDKKDNVYFYSQQYKGFFYPDFKTHEIIPVEKKDPSSSLNNFFKNNYSLMGSIWLDHEAICIFSQRTGVTNEDYIYYYNTQTGRQFTDKIKVKFAYENRMSNAFPLNDSIFVINSFFGEPLIYNANNHEVKKASDQPLWFTSWPDGLGAVIYKDDNNIWVGTSKSLLQSSLKTNFFKTNNLLTDKLKDNQALVSYNYGLYNNNKLWVACMGAGIFGVDFIHNTVDTYFDESTPKIYNKKRISTEVVNADNSLWLFSVYGPVQINTTTKTLSSIQGINKDSVFDDRASYPLKDSKGNIWTTLPDGVSRYDVAAGSFTNFTTRYKGGNFPLLKAGPKTEDNAGNIWMARQDTLVKYDPATQTFSTAFINKTTRPLRQITNMASDGGDILYLGLGGYFGIYSTTTKNIEVFTKQTGIISTAINDIVSDKQGNAWIATEGGLVFYNKQKRKFSSFTKADGLPDDNVISINFADAEKKTLFLGFSKNYCLFEPQDFFLEKTVPQNIITGIEVGGDLFSADEPQTFSYKQNSISFTYTGINYNQGQQNNYACMLEGFDQDWKYTGTERKINYVNLPPAKYIFKIKSANHQGEWNEQPAIYEFEILPPFWQRWWFRILIACLVIFGIWYFIKRREAVLQKENKIKLQMSELRMQALRAQMNPHFIFNSLNSIQNYILSNNTIDAAGYLSKFAKLMRRILDQSKHNFLPLGEAMETLKLYVEIEAFRFNNEFSYIFNIEDNDELLDANIPPMLLQPFVENAILHGLMPKKGDKKLTISCKLVGHNVEIVIDDNGIGRTQHNAKAGHTSQGEKLTAGMLESLQHMQNNKASIEFIDKTENNISTGTTVKLVLPLN